jgi:predicted ATP-grasp superfamily ATP-dependent carboligase
LAVLVTDGNQRSTLAFVRALGSSGVGIVVGEASASSLAGKSRYCARRMRYPSPVERPEEFLDFLDRQLRSGQYEMVVPMTDVTLQLVARLRESLDNQVHFPFPGKEQVGSVQDKRQVFQIARQMGIPCPVTYSLDEHRDVNELAQRVQFPVVIKPRFSRYFDGRHLVLGSVRYANDPEALISMYRTMHEQIPCPLVQERIEGEGRGLFLLIWDGDLKAAFCHRRLREKPPWGGVSVYSESTPLDRAMVEKSFELLKALGWHGVAMVEFKVDGRDGQPKLMEVNGRFWGSLQLAIDAGVNFPVLLYRLAHGENVMPEFDYRVGVRSRWLLGDLDHLLIRMTYSGPLKNVLERQGSRTRAVCRFMKLFERNMRYDVFRLNDLAPAWFELKQYVQENLLRPRNPVHAA